MAQFAALSAKKTLDGGGAVHIISLGVVLRYLKTALHATAFMGIEEEFSLSPNSSAISPRMWDLHAPNSGGIHFDAKAYTRSLPARANLRDLGSLCARS
jgi:hypothetical protein